jgi:hypothetical protein
MSHQSSHMPVISLDFRNEEEAVRLPGSCLRSAMTKLLLVAVNRGVASRS